MNDVKVKMADIVELENFREIRDNLGTIVCTSCPGDPIHPGHISCLMDSTRFGDTLVVIVNGDWFLTQKKGKPFMPLAMRCQIIAGIKGVDIVIPFEIEDDTTVIQALDVIRPHVFTKGGDRCSKETIPEWDICKAVGTRLYTGIGDSKVHSSSNLLEDWYQSQLEKK